MRVLQVSNTFPPADISGVGTLVAELHAELLRSGHDAVAVVRRAPAGAGIVAVGGSKLLFPLAAARAYLRLSRAERSLDVVHVHESDGVLVALLVRLQRALGGRGARPLLYATLQVSYARERRAVRAVRAERGGWTTGRIVSRPVASEWIFKLVRAPLLSLLGRLTARLADGVVTPSEATAAEVREDYGVRAASVIPNGIDAEADAAAPASRSGGTVLFVGRLRTRKAVAVLLEAWPLVARELEDARLVLLGDGEQRQPLARQIERLGIGGSVRLAGAVPRAETARWLAEADVFCLPSTYEGFPLAILEAMAAGLPVVATAVAGIPEAVDDRTGILVPPEDAAALSAALLRLLRDPELRERMGRAGRQRLTERFSIPTVTAAYLRLWQSPAGPTQLPPAT